MKTLLNRIHARVGDLWWYSAMIFVACRSGDVIQAFIGLWLVPKYVGPGELGAVLPIQQLTSFLTVPLGIVAVVFAKYVNTYAARGEFGKVKSFIHDVFTSSVILFILCIGGAYLIMPFFYERLRISAGSLTFLILLCGLVGNIGTIVGSAQQGLKRFKTMSVQALVSAPVRLVTMLVAMPIRALSGYMLGQTTPGIVTTSLAYFDIRGSLKSYTPDKTWRKDIPAILRYMGPIVIYMAFGTFFSSISATVYRQRLPEIESSAYYVLSRLSEISTFVGSSMMVILVPLASEAHEKGEENAKILVHTVMTIIGSGFILAALFLFFGKTMLNAVDIWMPYAKYACLLPIQTLCTVIIVGAGTIVSYEMACRRFGTAALSLTLNLLFTTILVSFTGADFFHELLPDVVISAMKECHVASLSRLTRLTFAFSIMHFILIAASARLHKRTRP